MCLLESAEEATAHSHRATGSEQPDYISAQALRVSEYEAGRRSQAPLICVVDDDASLLRSLRNLLRAAGFRVETFESAATFLMSGDRQRADCLVVDLQMPGLSGVGLMLELKESGSNQPVILLTGHGEEQIRQRCLRAGAVGFLTKPFESAELLDEIEAVISAATRIAPEG